MIDPTALELVETENGVNLLVLAQPGAKKNGLNGIHNSRLKIAVTQAPEKGKANKAIIHVLSEKLGIAKSKIELVTGETSKLKTFWINEITAEEFLKKIEAI